MPDTQPGTTGAMTPVCLLGPRDGWLAEEMRNSGADPYPPAEGSARAALA